MFESILILFLMLASGANAQSFMAEAQMGNASPEFYSKRSVCESAQGGSCAIVSEGYDSRYSELADYMVDDPSSPILETINETVYADQEAYDLGIVSYDCGNDGHSIVSVGLTVNCQKIIGYNQMVFGKKVVDNAGLKATADAQDAQAQADAQARADYLKANEDGKKVVAEFRFLVKDLSDSDKNILFGDSVIQVIISNLNVGRVSQAKALADTLDLPNLPIDQAKVDEIKAYMTGLGY